MNEDFAERYYQAFAAANPGREVPVIIKASPGWFAFKGTPGKKRQSEIEAMTVRLEERVQDPVRPDGPNA